MSILRRLCLSSLLALSVLALVLPSVGTRPALAEPPGQNPIMGGPRMTPQAMAAWFRSATKREYRASVDLDTLAALFVEEGIRYNVRGDVAFAQSILETLWFNFPDYGQVRPSDNNYAGIGACNSCTNGYDFPSPRLGVRAQIQHLRNYADPTVRASNLPDPPLLRGFDTFFLKGKAPTWEGLNGKWAVPGTTYAQSILSIYQRMLTFAGVSESCPPDAPLGAAGTDGRGYWLASADGGVFGFGAAPFFGSLGNTRLNAPVLSIVPTPSGNGYWLIASDGGIFSFGDAKFFGSTGSLRLNKPVVGMTPTPSGNGYWLVASDGGIFAFGDARFFGSTGAMRINRPVVGMAATPTGNGYWLVAADGGIFTFGDAQFLGSTGSLKLNRAVVAMASTPSGKGYWLVGGDGGVFTFGDAPFQGSLGGCRNREATGIARANSADGYWMITKEGRVAAFGAAKHFGWAFVTNTPPVALAVLA
ncbi:MAG: glucosaminidase domain-containing protein [Acidimicrobiia bacterium]